MADIVYTQIYILPCNITDNDKKKIKQQTNKEIRSDSCFLVDKIRERSEKIEVNLTFDWKSATLRDYGEKKVKYTQMIQEDMYELVKKGTLTITQDGVYLWQVKIPKKKYVNFTPEVKTLVSTMMYKPIWCLRIIEDIFKQRYTEMELMNRFRRGLWPHSEFTSNDELKDMIDVALDQYLTNFNYNTMVYNRLETIARQKAIIKMYYNRMNVLFDSQSLRGERIKEKCQNLIGEYDYWISQISFSKIDDLSGKIIGEINDQLW